MTPDDRSLILDVWQVLFTSEMRVGVTKRHLSACTKPTVNCDFDAPPKVGLFTGHEVVDPHSYVGLNINRKLPNPLRTRVSPKRRMRDTTDLWGPYQKNLEWRSLYIAKHISGEQYQIAQNQNDETGM